MSKKIQAIVMAAVLLAAGSGLIRAGALPVQAEETQESTAADPEQTEAADAVTAPSDEGENAAETSEASQAAAGEVYTGNLADYLGVDQGRIEQIFDIDTVNRMPNGGDQLISDDGILFQTDAQGEVDYISLYKSSIYSVNGVFIGTDRYLAQAAFWAFGWTDRVIDSSFGSLWTFFSPDRKATSTVMTDGDGQVVFIAITRMSGQAAAE